uniref:Uncharacterized protein n=1 Tax=Romanomermis culicivorax TaxID=13658 RepID=A0A915HK19_ROMCU
MDILRVSSTLIQNGRTIFRRRKVRIFQILLHSIQECFALRNYRLVSTDQLPERRVSTRHVRKKGCSLVNEMRGHKQHSRGRLKKQKILTCKEALKSSNEFDSFTSSFFKLSLLPVENW